MTRMMWAAAVAAVLSGAASVHAAEATTQPRTVAVIAAEVEAAFPKQDPARAKDKAYQAEQEAAFQKALVKSAEGGKEAFALDPDSAETGNLLLGRWRAMGQLGQTAEAVPEMKAYLESHPNYAKREMAAYYLAVMELYSKVAKTAEERAAAVAYFEKIGGKGKMMPAVLMLASQGAESEAESLVYLKRVTGEFAESAEAKSAAGKMKAVEAVGKPFELAFKDVVTGKDVSIAGLKGKVVVVDFWATWCGPCTKELPRMKKIYEEYKAKGVEFVGVSLDGADEGALELVKTFVAEKGVPWAQYYQGNGWQSAFSNGWGVNSIPRVFVVDAEGKLASQDAQKDLEKILDGLVKKQ